MEKLIPSDRARPAMIDHESLVRKEGWIIKPDLWHLMDDHQAKQEGWKILILFDNPDAQFAPMPPHIWKCAIVAHFDTFDHIEDRAVLGMGHLPRERTEFSREYRKRRGLPIQDDEAVALVMRKAEEGSAFHARALAVVIAVQLRGSID